MRNGFNTLLEVVQNDFDYELSFALQDSAGVTTDISSSTAAFIAQFDGDDSLNFSNPMTITNAPQGKCKYSVLATDFVAAGTWNAQIKITYLTGEVITFAGIQIVVTAELPV